MNVRKGNDTAVGKRVVTHLNSRGKSDVHPDITHPRAHSFQAIPGMRSSILWATECKPSVPLKEYADPVHALNSIHPAPGESVFMTLTLPPDSVMMSPSFDASAAAYEHQQHAPGIAERMEEDSPGFHTTDTIDYVVVLEGKVCLETDSGEISLSRNDCVIQNGTRHAWHNRSATPATVAIVMLGADRLHKKQEQ